MKNVMTRAWEIAKGAVIKFGGKVKEYFAESLRMAWSEIKKGADKMESRRADKEARRQAFIKENTVEVTIELPELVGTEKQIKWAEDIRVKYLEKVEEMNNEMRENERFKKSDLRRFQRELGIFYLLSDGDDKDVTNPTEAVNKVLSNNNAGEIINTLKHLTK